MAGSLRAKYALPLPDMLQVAIALREAQPTLITHDKALKRVKEAKVLTIAEAVEA
jgi:predicted nucleic acid-binding protein